MIQPGKIKFVKGDLIKLAIDGHFDLIVHGCNCFCTQRSGIAPHMAKHFDTANPVYYPGENPASAGFIGKLGNIEYRVSSKWSGAPLIIVNAYTQYWHSRNMPTSMTIPLDYEALTLCLRKINRLFTGRRIGLPKIGSGRARGDWNIILQIITTELTDSEVTIVEYDES